MTQARIAALRSLLTGAELDGLLITGAANRRYLSGFTGSAGALLISAGRALLVTDGRYTTQASAQAPEFQIVTRNQTETLAQALAAASTAMLRVGFDPNAVTYAEHQEYSKAFGSTVTLVPAAGLVETCRMVKDSAEIATLRKAIAITDAALAATLPQLRPEHSERQAAWMLHQALVERGAEGVAFEIIVAAGPNSALPHARPTDAELGVGRPIVIDFGALYQGYHADMTRTVILGAADERFLNVYDTVRMALDHATAHIKPGLAGSAADVLARDRIAAAGYGHAFSHSLGHGVGLEIHEDPRLSMTSAQALPAGAVFSIEPGIYLPEWGGVRLENLALLTQDGAETLTASPLDQPVLAATH